METMIFHVINHVKKFNHTFKERFMFWYEFKKTIVILFAKI